MTGPSIRRRVWDTVAAEIADFPLAHGRQVRLGATAREGRVSRVRIEPEEPRQVPQRMPLAFL